MQRLAFQGLEPCDGKLSRTVLRGKGGRKAPAPPGNFLSEMVTTRCCMFVNLVSYNLKTHPEELRNLLSRIDAGGVPGE